MFEDWLKLNIDKLTQEYYKHPQIAPLTLFGLDQGFRTYCRNTYNKDATFEPFDSMFGNPMDQLNSLTIRKNV